MGDNAWRRSARGRVQSVLGRCRCRVGVNLKVETSSVNGWEPGMHARTHVSRHSTGNECLCHP